VFPDHWSFLFGEIALYAFIVLVATGTYLALFFDPSTAHTIYDGSYAPLRGQRVTEAYRSVIDLSFDVRAGLLIRQIHHWGALIFIVSVFAHMARVFFTGAFRKPREINWVFGTILSMLACIEGFAGYSLPDDLLSGTGIRAMNGFIQSIPVVGSYVSYFLFGGAFPGEAIVPRLYSVHILLIPAILVGLFTAHILLVFVHKHTQYPGPGRTNTNVVGYPLMPVYIAKAGGFFFMVFGVITLISALFTINPIWAYGPYDPSPVTAGSQPDWYMGFVEGAVRVMPNWELTFLNYTWSLNVFIPGVLLMGVLFTALGAWPFVESWITGDKREHHLLERPRNAPVRTAFGVAGMTMYAVFWIGGGNDIIATKFHLSLNAITWFVRIGWIVLPVIAFMVTKRICIGLQRADANRILHGYETGIIERTPDGSYSERHAPLPVADQFVLTSHDRLPVLEAPAEEDANGVAAPGTRRARLRAKARSFYYDGAIDKPTSDDVEHAAEHLGDHDGHPVPLGEDFQGVSETGIPRSH
jgi:ubiquinol-cytochrome c reductase cytochrome b subunit